MSSTFQTIAALVVVVMTVVWFIARAVAKRKKPGCGGDCGCDSSVVKKRSAELR